MWIKQLLLISLIIGGLGNGLIGLAQANVYCDKWTKQYHDEGCVKIPTIQKHNYMVYKTKPEAESRGYYPCQLCFPPLSKGSNIATTRQVRSMPIKKVKNYIGDESTKLCHHAWCDQVKSIKQKKRVKFTNIDHAWKRKYQPCDQCYPPVKPEVKQMNTMDEKGVQQESSTIKPEME